MHENLKTFLKMVLEGGSLGRCLYRGITALKGAIAAMTEVHGNLSASDCIKIDTGRSHYVHHASTLMSSLLESLEGEN